MLTSEHNFGMSFLSPTGLLAQVFTDQNWRTLMWLSAAVIVVAIYLGYARKQKIVMYVLLTIATMMLIFLTIFWKNFASAETARALYDSRDARLPQSSE